MIAQTGQVTLSSPRRPEFTLEVRRALRPQSRHDVDRLERHPTVLSVAGVDSEEIVIGRESADADA
jgi:hypothetical protein